MKNKAALIHKQAEEKRAMVEARRGEERLKAEETAAKYRATGHAPKKLLGCFWSTFVVPVLNIKCNSWFFCIFFLFVYYVFILYVIVNWLKNQQRYNILRAYNVDLRITISSIIRRFYKYLHVNCKIMKLLLFYK